MFSKLVNFQSFCLIKKDFLIINLLKSSFCQSKYIDIEDEKNKVQKFGKLIICPTPLGNLQDFSLRQLNQLKNSEIIACEDTRQTGKLLNLIESKNILQDFDCFQQKDLVASLNDSKISDENDQEQEVDKMLKDVLESGGFESRDEKLQKKIEELRKEGRKMLIENDTLNIYGEQDFQSNSENDFSFFGVEDEFIKYLKLKIQFNQKRKGRGVFISYHKYNEELRLERLIKIMKYGISITLVSDAGVPCISDPGYKLVERCYEEGLEVESLPGGSSVTLALSQCGFPTDSFYFLGFLSKNQNDREKSLNEARGMKKSTIFFESLQRLSKTLLSIEKTYGPKQIIWIGSELTKLYEKKRKGTVQDIYEFVSENEREKKNWKGELVIVIAPSIRKYNLDIIEDINSQEIKQNDIENDNNNNLVQIHLGTALAILNDRLEVSDQDLASLAQEIFKVSKNKAYNEIKKIKHSQKENKNKFWHDPSLLDPLNKIKNQYAKNK